MTNRTLLLEHAIRTQRRLQRVVSPEAYADAHFGYIETHFGQARDKVQSLQQQ